MRITLTLLIACVLIAGNGCATVFKGNNSNVGFVSQPAGAEVFVNGFKMGQTPMQVKLESKKTQVVEFRMAGYKPQTFTLTNSVGAGWVVLDVLFGIIPVVVDAVTGAWYSLEPDTLNAYLEADGSGGGTGATPRR